MKALICHKYGPVDTMRVRTIPDPKPKPNEVVVDVAYAPVSFPDTLIVQGLYQVKPALPFVPGHEFSGIISEVGVAVKGHKVGDRVFVSSGTGGITQRAVVHENQIKKVHPAISLEKVSCLSVTYITALHALKDLAQLQEGETVLVLGASGGTGSAAIEVAKLMGARVIAAASTDEKLEYCRGIGADFCINYDTEDLKERVEEFTNNRGVDIVVDMVGDRYAEPAFRSTAFRGRYLVVGFAAGEIPKIPLNLALLRERSIIGVYGLAAIKNGTQEIEVDYRMLMNWLAQGKLSPVITARYSLENVVEALKFASSRQAMGKIVVEVNSELK
jgi:NADPH2:quinone reductase